MDIVIASGKGGTGKTMISAALAEHVAASGAGVTILDCDVEEPNANILLNIPVSSEVPSEVPVPVVDTDRCSGCGLCDRLCRFNAIPVIRGEPLVLPELCHGCGGCVLVCPEKAIRETVRAIGTVEEGGRGSLRYVGGRLNVGEAMSPPLIRAVKKYHHGTPLRFIDAPPGTSCPAVAAASGADYAILVAEPTPFGMNDFILALGMMRALNIPVGVVINKDGCGTGDFEEYCVRENIEILAKIPLSMELASAYSKGAACAYMMANHGNALEAITNGIEAAKAGCP